MKVASLQLDFAGGENARDLGPGPAAPDRAGHHRPARPYPAGRGQADAARSGGDPVARAEAEWFGWMSPLNAKAIFAFRAAMVPDRFDEPTEAGK